MATRQNKNGAGWLIESIWNQRDLTITHRNIDSSSTSHGPFHDQFAHSLQGLSASLSIFIDATTDKTPSALRGMRQGQLVIIATTDKCIAVKGMSLDRINRGHVVRNLCDWSPQDMLCQFGVVTLMK